MNAFVKGLSDLDLTTEGSFVQEYISNPFLVDGYKFDIGIYTTLTSIDPLRSVSSIQYLLVDGYKFDIGIYTTLTSIDPLRSVSSIQYPVSSIF